MTVTAGPAKVWRPEGGVPIKSWATHVEDGAIDQAENLSRLPFAIDHIALMPDTHQGYGMPIGGALFTELAVVPNAIGVDIGCGVILSQLEGARADDLLADDRAMLRAALAQILRDVPVGNGPGGNHKEPPAWPNRLAEHPAAVEWGWVSKAQNQLGTLGGGNHFIEIQADDEGTAYVMLHSGSRSLGKRICDHYHAVAVSLNQLWHSRIPDAHRPERDRLAFLPWETPEARAYWEAMTYALVFAEENRARMMGAVASAVGRHAGASLTPIVDCHHNYAAWENHGGRNGIVHRKGAVRARAGEDVLIPGSMGTGSYWGKGLGSPDSFATCQHGAGRQLSRGAARLAYTGGVAEMQAELDAVGTLVYAPDVGEVLDEAPRAYKPIETVMSSSADLVAPYRRLRPLGTVKG